MTVQLDPNPVGGKDFIAQELAAGRFEPALQRMFPILLSTMRKGDGFVDVGANSGLYTLLAAEARHDISIDALEPFPPAVDALRRNLALNDLAERVNVHQVALGEVVDAAELYLPATNHGYLDSSASLQPDFHQAPRGTVVADVARLDDLQLAAPPGLIKADIEGGEPAMIAGGVRTLSLWRPLIVLEIIPPTDFPRLEQQRRTLDYVDIRLHPEAVIVGQPVSFDEHAWNHLWVPAMRLPGFLPVLSRNGFRIQSNS
jgi:FkbM family methyltransferase